MMFSLIILSLSIKNLNADKKDFIFYSSFIMYILGINLGPEYLCAVNINNADLDMLVLIILSAIAVIITIVCYIIYSIKNKNNIFYKIDIRIDILFILYIFLCILQSSLTIRVELRFILSSFIGFFMYVSHMLMIVLREPVIPYYDMKKNLPRLTYIMLICFILFLASRISTSIYYKKCNEKIFFSKRTKSYKWFL